MNRCTTLFASLALAGVFAGAAHAQPVMRDGVLADAAGRTVYTFDKDEMGKSNCSGGCLTLWPAFVAKPEAVAKGDFGVIEANGVRQWTVKGKPLYFYAADAKPGDRNGDGKGGVWHVVTDKAATAATAPSSSNYTY